MNCKWCHGDHSGNCDTDALREEIRKLKALEAARSKLPGDNVVMVRSLISHRTRKPRIDIQIGELHTQMVADAAMEVALMIIKCAHGAYADAFVFHFLKSELKADDAASASIVEQFRGYRETLAADLEAMQEKNK